MKISLRGVPGIVAPQVSILSGDPLSNTEQTLIAALPSVQQPAAPVMDHTYTGNIMSVSSPGKSEGGCLADNKEYCFRSFVY